MPSVGKTRGIATRAHGAVCNVRGIHSRPHQLIFIGRRQVEEISFFALECFLRKMFKKGRTDAITAGTDRRTEGDPQILGTRIPLFAHEGDRLRADLLLRPAPARVDKANDFMLKIIQKYRKTIGGAYRDGQVATVGQDPVGILQRNGAPAKGSSPSARGSPEGRGPLAEGRRHSG